MDWWGKVVFPLRRAWEAVAARIEASRKTGTGILKLHDDVRTCGYGDVQVMWEMLRSEMEISHATRRKRICWRALAWSCRSAGVERHQRC
ncbi:unnamed protein product [Spirodela intermedia]|uniref:Uncharacterized protein n=1 Tax=Spirodela intermedia TaxID=51605 RepID=A0A7I8IX14_SPIIN|nr:unnamed protein product [Spirodela intermedia]CAA6662321.1 unnamed protein product [Spirodela intermedia]